MTDYTNYVDIWMSDSLKKQIVFACMKTANYILTTEPNNAQNHQERVNWAKLVVADPYEMAMRMSVAVIASPDVQAGNPSDAQVQYVVDLMVDVYAEL